jgi:hypothetical protein
MKRRPDDDRIFAPRRPETLDGDFGVAPSVPTIQTPAPVAPGSETSREAAELVSVDGECLKCLLWYHRQPGPRTRYDLAIAVYPPDPTKHRKVAGTGPACGRTNDLVELGYLVEVGRDGRSATLAVTDNGRRWLAKRGVGVAAA